MPTHIERVITFGDSLTLGLGAKDKGWVQLLHERYRELNKDQGEATQTPRIFHELGAFAAKAADLAKSAPDEASRRFWLPEEKGGYDRTKRLSIVSIGTNDSWLRAATGDHVTPLSKFRQSIGQIATALVSQSELLYIGLFPPDEELCGKFWNTATPPQLESRLTYETEAIRIFRELGAHVLPMVQEASQAPQYTNNFTPDGVHLKPAGEQWVYERVRPVFDSLVV